MLYWGGMLQASKSVFKHLLLLLKSDSVSRSLLVLIALISTRPALAEEKLFIPSYDHAIYEDGFERWTKATYKPVYIINKSVLFDNLDKQISDSNRLRSNRASGRNDRTSNHIAMTYSITVKGYCLYEANEDFSRLWSFNKVKLYMNKKPELFFGVQKPFH